MSNVFAFDTETTIKNVYHNVEKTIKKLNPETNKKEKVKLKVVEREIHKNKAFAKDPDNDFHTIIYGDHPDRIKLLHSEQGFKRTLPTKVSSMLLKSKTMVGVNLKFDLLYIWEDPNFRQWIINGGKIWDCQLVRYLLSAQRHRFPSLAELQVLYLKIKTKEARISYLYKKGIGADHIIKARRRCPRLWKLYKYYSKEDGRTPLLIYKKQYKEAKRRKMLKVIRLYNKYLLSLCMMEHNGIPVNIQEAHQVRQEFTVKMVEELGKAQEQLKEIWDNRLDEFNVNSPDHKSVALFGGVIIKKIPQPTGEYYKTGEKKGQEKYKKIDTEIKIKGLGLDPRLYSRAAAKPGFYSVDDKVVNTIYDKCKNKKAVAFCRHMKAAAIYKKMISTYLTAFIDQSINGNIRCNYNNCVTITSRLSSSEPNLQNIPSKNEEFKEKVQGLLYGPDQWVCAQIDYAQLEVYCLAALSKDKKMLKDLVNGVDFHVKRLAYAEQMSYEEAYKLCCIDKIPEWVLKRKKAKTISFQKQYGAFITKIAEETGRTEEEIKRIFDEEDKEYPYILDWIEHVVTSSVTSKLELSHKKGLASQDTKIKKGGKRFYRDIELLPIKNKKTNDEYFDKNEFRHVGYYQSPTGKLYGFEEKATLISKGKNAGNLFKYFPPTQLKNYQIQGTAADCQALSSALMFNYLFNNGDKVKLVNEIHDSKWFLIKKEHLHTILPKLCTIMSNIRPYFKKYFGWDTGIDFKVDAEIGPNFNNLTEYKQPA